MIEILSCSTTNVNKEYRNKVDRFEKEVKRKTFDTVVILENFIEDFFGVPPVYVYFSPASLTDLFKMLNNSSKKYKGNIEFFIPNNGNLKIKVIIEKK